MTDEFLIITESAAIDATAESAYAVISDYRSGHPSILPKQFHSLKVESGGVGAGTIINFQVKTFGQNKTLRAEISEPQPGCVLLEKYPDTGTETTFTVVPVGPGCEVTITTKMKTRTGIPGKIERFLMERFLRPLFKEELRNLNRVASL